MDKKRRKKKEPEPTQIVVERVYLGGQSMEEAFTKINEDIVKENLEIMLEKAV